MRCCSRYNTITKIFREGIVEQILSHPNFKPSCVSSDVVTVFKPESNQKEFLPKMPMGIYVRDLRNDMIKPYNNGELAIVVDSVTQEVLISDIIPRPFIPPQVWKMTPKDM